MQITEHDKARYLRHMLPYGIVRFDGYAGDDPRSAHHDAAVQDTLLKEGILRVTTIHACNKIPHDIDRLVLTRKGVSVALADQDIYTSIPTTTPVRGRLDDRHFQVVSRCADVTRYFESIGVDTVKTTIAKGLNPYILGYPTVDSASPVLHQAITAANIAWLEAHDYPMYTASSGSAIFLSKHDMPRHHPNPNPRDGDYYSRRYNNCLGVLIDLHHTTTYYIFYDYSGGNNRWQTKAYHSLNVSLDDRLRNIYTATESVLCRPAYPILSCAIIFAEKDEYLNITTNTIPKMRGLYSHVFGLTLDSAGAYHLHQLLNLGTRGYTTWSNQWLCDNDRDYSLESHGDLLYLDDPVIPCIIPEYRNLAYEIHELIMHTGRVPYVACGPEYKDMVQRLMRFSMRKSGRYREVRSAERSKIVEEHIVPISPYRSQPQMYPLIPGEYYNHDYATFLFPISAMDDQDIISISTDDTDNSIFLDFYLDF